MQVLSLSYLIRETEICLGYKNRGIGRGYWNGFGGKVKAGETIKEAAVREIAEEATTVVEPEDLEQVARVEFIFEDGTHLDVHIFFVRRWRGAIRGTDEMMHPTWYAFDAIPYQEMWEDDAYWLPRALAGERLRGRVYFDHTDRKIKEMEWTPVASCAE